MEGLVFKDIIYEKKEGIAEITINRPHAYNAFASNTLRGKPDFSKFRK
jgi:1,4-dihydroxy-2-naphthoyl-CoA synthase